MQTRDAAGTPVPTAAQAGDCAAATVSVGATGAIAAHAVPAAVASVLYRVSQDARALIIFARAPELGLVKTRIAADLGQQAALDIYRELGRNTVHAARAVRDCTIVVQYTPLGSEAGLVAWLGSDVLLQPQTEGDLGARMSSAIDAAVHRGARHAVVIGTDCPSLDTAILGAAFDALATTDVVIGPATDGGYYLIGVTQSRPALFTGIPWSSTDTLGATLAAASAAGLGVALLDTRSDIDTAADWQRWSASR